MQGKPLSIREIHDIRTCNTVSFCSRIQIVSNSLDVCVEVNCI